MKPYARIQVEQEMGPSPLVSVIVVVRNGERYVAQALESILQSKYRPIEILMVDGQSTDKTADIAREYPLVRYFLQPNTGIAAAYNFGIQEARGEFVAFNSYDDVWNNDKLSLQVRYLHQHPEIQFVTGKAKFFLEPGCLRPAGFRKELFEDDHVCHIMETLVARKSAFEQIGLFNTRLSTAEDVDWFARAHDYGILGATLPHVVLYKRIHKTNSSLHPQENNQNLLKVIKESIARKRKCQSGSDREALVEHD